MNTSLRLIVQTSLKFNRVATFVRKRAPGAISCVNFSSCSRNYQRNYIIHNFKTTSSGHRFLNSVKSFSSMPPIDRPEEALRRIEEAIKNNRICIFSKTYCPFCTKVKGLFEELGTPYYALELDIIDKNDAALLQDALKQRTGMSTVPNVFVNGQHIGGCDDTFKFHEQKKLLPLLAVEEETHPYQYDLVVIGGGSGGLAASKEAAKYGKKVAVCDFVKPTPIGTTWGLGGTCVNVGCIPKKLMHQSALLGTAVQDATAFGWQIQSPATHDWNALVEGIQNYIGSLNWGYRVALREAKVNYLNEFAEFVDEHTLLTTNKKGKQQQITSKNFLVAVGGRPRYPDIPGAREYGITSDDLFALPHNPGKVLCIGASYIALECAGFLAGFGLDTTVMVRSILLRGFDQQVAEYIGEYMEGHNVRFLKGWIPTGVEKIEDGTPPRLRVSYKSTETGEETSEEFNTVVFAIGRDPCTPDLKLEKIGVQLSQKTGKIVTNAADQSSINNIYAIGDVAENRPELTPVAIQAGILLAQRLCAGKSALTDYDKVPTTVFTPLEYGCVGLSEEDAIAKYGEANIEVYHTNFQPLELTLPKRDENKCYAKLVCNKQDHDRVVGFHYLGPNAGEVTQGFAIGIKLNACKADFDGLIGIHPTCAEIFTTLTITKSSGASALKKGC